VVQASRILDDVARMPVELAGTVQGLTQKADLRSVLHEVAEGRDDLQRRASDLGQRVLELSESAIPSKRAKARRAKKRRTCGIFVMAAILLVVVVATRMRGREGNAPEEPKGNDKSPR
jgi:hypothetical protein